MFLQTKDTNISEGVENQTAGYDALDHNVQFYSEYKKIFITGYHLAMQLKQLVSQKEDIWKKLLNYEVLEYI